MSLKDNEKLKSSDKAEPRIRQFKLISVNFKEAALDSPSFRATVNHLDIQIDNIEKWLLALVSTVKKISKYVQDLSSFSNSFLEHLMPSFFQDGLIDHEYTVESLTTTAMFLKRLWNTCLAALTVNTYVVENVYTIISKKLKIYKELRKKYEIAQEKYDRYLEIYMSIPKSKEAMMVMEDGKQLYQVRKEYIRASLDIITELSSLSSFMDKALVKLCTDLWRNQKPLFLNDKGFFNEHKEKVLRIQSWCDVYSDAIDKLSSDILSARSQVEESSILQFIPSNNIDDYKISSINSKTLADIEEQSIEKHGYLFMKTWTDKSSKPIWVRRWVFIRGGVFGLLVLSPSQTFVQESDKIGLLLCNVKYAANEDRRFCFEVKTIDNTIIFQAETLLELKSWLKVFENEKNRILQENADSDSLDIASGRYPPIITEFASTANTIIDSYLTSSRITDKDGQIITSSRLSSHIEKNEKYFQKHIYYQIPQIRPPFITETTKSSIIAYSLVAANDLPTALTANIWGSVNWGLYYLHEGMENQMPDMEYTQGSEMTTTYSDSKDSGINYPDYYPPELVPTDIQMRSLFETAVEPGELCLLSFRCIWSPNSRQELDGRCFITINHIYFYMQALGFVALYKGFVGHLISVDYTAQKNYDLLKIYNLDGCTKLKLFLHDGKIIKQKLVCLINNRTSDKPKSLEEVIHDLVNLESNNEIEQKEQAESIVQPVLLSSPHPQKDMTPGTVASFILSKEGNKATKYQVDFSKNACCVFEKSYNVPPKAIFHALLGDNSIILKDQTSLTHLECLIKKPWSTLPDGRLRRIFNVPVKYGRNERGEVQFEQIIDNMSDDEYYTFTHTRSIFKFFIGEKFKVHFRYVIVGIAGKQTRVYVYAKRIFFNYSIFNGIVDRLCHALTLNECKILDRRLRVVVKEVGGHGMVVKAIYLYGKLSYTNDQDEEKDAPFIKFGLVNVLNVVSRKIASHFLAILSDIILVIANGLITFAKGIKVNQTLALIIIISGLFNFFLLGKTTTSYWKVQKASQIANNCLSTEPMMLQRAIYLKDTEQLLESKFNLPDFNNLTSNSRCFNKFKEISFVLNFDKTSYWNEDYGDESTREVAKNFKKSFQEIGVERHNLLVKLRMLNQLEKEIGKGEWKNWLMNELQRCDYIKHNIFNQVNQTDGESILAELGPGVESVLDFCNSCSDDLKYVDLL